MQYQKHSITLRPLRADDIDDFLVWAGDSQVTQSLFWDPHVDRSKAYEFMKSVVEPHKWFKAICVDGVPVGAITLDVGIGRASARAELGYVVAKKFWGKGYATKAVELAIEHGLKDLGISRIEAFVDPENSASVRVLEKSGMQNEAYLKDYVVHRSKVRDRLLFSHTSKKEE